MSQLFLTVLNMSLTASYVIIFVMLIRLPLKKVPKVISYALWSVVAFRLIIPFSFENMFSLMPRNTNAVPIPHDIIYQQSPQINSGIVVVDSFVSESFPTPTVGASVNPLQVYIEIGAYIWILGMIALLVYSLVSVLLLKRQLKSAQLIEQNIFEAKNLKTPFVLGLIRPKIYLPVGLNIEERSYILLHEQTNIHRKDHIIKVLAFLTVSIHWFNPIVWIAFRLMSADMELSCDERVLKEMNEDVKKPYANSLLSLATGRHILNGSPLAFGEGNVKGRIKNVLNYKKPKFWVLFFSIVVVTTIGIGLITNPQSISFSNEESIQIGRYVTEDGLASVEIKEGKQFYLNRHIATSYDPIGNYIIVGDKLVLQVNGDEKETIEFKISEDKLVFESGKLAESLIKKGAVFIYEEERDLKNNITDKTNDWKTTTNETVNNFFGVSMTIKEGTVSSIGLIVVFENISEKKCIYGEHFLLEKKISGRWYQVPVAIDGDYGFNDIGYVLDSGDNREWKVDWNWLYGSLDIGEYRIVKDILDFRDTGDYDKYYLAAEFTVY